MFGFIAESLGVLFLLMMLWNGVKITGNIAEKTKNDHKRH